MIAIAKLVVTGVLIGFAATLLVGRLVSRVLYGVTAGDPISVAGAAVVLLAVTAAPAFALSGCAVAGDTAACAGPSSSCAAAGGTVACAVPNFFNSIFGFFSNLFGFHF